jgi:hypothetical protein
MSRSVSLSLTLRRDGGSRGSSAGEAGSTARSRTALTSDNGGRDSFEYRATHSTTPDQRFCWFRRCLRRPSEARLWPDCGRTPATARLLGRPAAGPGPGRVSRATASALGGAAGSVCRLGRPLHGHVEEEVAKRELVNRHDGLAGSRTDARVVHQTNDARQGPRSASRSQRSWASRLAATGGGRPVANELERPAATLRT